MTQIPTQAAENVPDGRYVHVQSGVVTKDSLDGTVERDWQHVCISTPGFRAERATLYDVCLPFHVHSQDGLPNEIDLATIEDSCQSHEWTSDECNIADESLERGYVLSFYAHPNWAISAAVFIAQNLTRNVYARYDEANRRLIIWDQNPREISTSCECRRGR